MQEIMNKIKSKINICLSAMSSNSTTASDECSAAAVEHLTRAMLNCYEIEKKQSTYERYKELEGKNA